MGSSKLITFSISDDEDLLTAQAMQLLATAGHKKWTLVKYALDEYIERYDLDITSKEDVTVVIDYHEKFKKLTENSPHYRMPLAMPMPSPVEKSKTKGKAKKGKTASEEDAFSSSEEDSIFGADDVQISASDKDKMSAILGNF